MFGRIRAMPTTSRDVLGLLAVAAVVRTVAAVIVSWPPYTDPAYYSLVAQQLATGHGFTSPVLWSFLEVGNHIPDPATLPVASNGHWMPLTSVVAAGFMAVLGPSWQVGQVPMVLIAAGLVPLTYIVGLEIGASRWQAVAAAVLALFSGPLLIMYSTIDNFAVFGACGAMALWSSVRATSSDRWGQWLMLAGIATGLVTLARVDGLLLAVAPLAAWIQRTGLTRSRPVAVPARAVGWGVASFAGFAVVVAPWLARNLSAYGSLFPSAGGHTLWIRSYNEQFSIGHEVSLSTFLSAGPADIIGSRLDAWVQLAGRTGVLLGGIFLIFFVVALWSYRRRPELAPFIAYFVLMFIVMGAVFTFHAPKGAYYHSAGAWLPFAFPLALMGVGPACEAAGKAWPFLRRAGAQRFLVVAGIVGAVVLSLVGSATLYSQWSVSRGRDLSAAAFLNRAARQGDVVMSSDPASLYPLTGLSGVAAPFDPFAVVSRVIDAYGVDWVVVTRPEPGTTDPLGLWNGAAAVDITGAHPAFLGPQPAFEAGNLRIFRVVRPGAP
jgi:hypothetical protein